MKYVINYLYVVRGAGAGDVHRGEPQAGGDGAQGPGGLHQDRAHPRGVAQDVRTTLRWDGHACQQGEDRDRK